MSNVGGLVAVVVLGASTVFLTAAGTAARTQPADTCVSTGASRTFRAQGIEGGSAVQVDTAKSARGEITAYLFGSLDPVRSTDGRRHTVSAASPRASRRASVGVGSAPDKVDGWTTTGPAPATWARSVRERTRDRRRTRL